MSVETPPRLSLTQIAGYFVRLGTFGFGGPIALAGYMQRDLVERRHWFTQEEYLQGLAVSQTLPGPLAAQLAMWLGYVRRGFWGACAAAVPFILPPFIIVSGLFAVVLGFRQSAWEEWRGTFQFLLHRPVRRDVVSPRPARCPQPRSPSAASRNLPMIHGDSARPFCLPADRPCSVPPSDDRPVPE